MLFSSWDLNPRNVFLTSRPIGDSQLLHASRLRTRPFSLSEILALSIAKRVTPSILQRQDRGRPVSAGAKMRCQALFAGWTHRTYRYQNDMGNILLCQRKSGVPIELSRRQSLKDGTAQGQASWRIDADAYLICSGSTYETSFKIGFRSKNPCHSLAP